MSFYLVTLFALDTVIGDVHVYRFCPVKVEVLITYTEFIYRYIHLEKKLYRYIILPAKTYIRIYTLLYIYKAIILQSYLPMYISDISSVIY